MAESTVHRIACLLGTSISLGSSVCMLLGLFVAWLLGLDLMLGVTGGGAVGVLLSLGIFAGSVGNLDASDGGLQEPLQVFNNVEATFTQKGKLGIAFAIRRSTRDGNAWLVVAEVAKRGQAVEAAPGLTPGMAVKRVHGRPLRLDTFEPVLQERPLQVTFGVVQRGDKADVDIAPPPPQYRTPAPPADLPTGAPPSVEPPPPPPPTEPPLPAEPPGPVDLDPEITPKLQEIFNKFDDDGDGTLSMRETNHFVVATGGKPFNERKWQLVCKMAGADPDEGLTLEAFAKVETSVEEDYDKLFGKEPEPEPEPPKKTRRWKPPTEEQKLELIFVKFDADMNGFLNMEEANQLMQQTGNKEYNLKKWKNLCKTIGANPGPGLSLDQFRDVQSEFVGLDFTLLVGNTPGIAPEVDMPEEVL